MRNRKRNWHNYSYGGDTYVTNNVMNVTNIEYKAHKRRRRHNGWGHGRKDRKPKLYRFCASGGLLDQDKVMRMSDGEVIGGLLENHNYAARNLSRDVGDICESGAGVVRGVFRGAFRVVEFIADGIVAILS